jgi:polyhydroxyalkanoate synthase
MRDQSDSGNPAPNVFTFLGNMARLAIRAPLLVQALAHCQSAATLRGNLDPLNIAESFRALALNLLRDPDHIRKAQAMLWRDYRNLMNYAERRFLGETPEPCVTPAPEDRRFADPAWKNSGYFDLIKQAYLLTANWMVETADTVEGMRDHDARKVQFYIRQITDAIAPTNFALSNPAVLRACVESNGENLIRGFDNFLTDLKRGNGRLRIRMVDEDAFEIGRNIATASGQIVYQNDLMQLIQYAPSTKRVFKRPLLIVPPWINKYYILDLREKNSLIRWAVAQGHTVFVISWVNPDESLAHKSFEDYLLEGVLAALGAIEQATGETRVNAVGYCLGGTLLAATLAHMVVKKDTRIGAATFLASMIDFSEPGDLGIFIDERQLQSLEARMKARGFLDGREMAATFNMMRANELIWAFVIHNYLLGKDPIPFDLLYWNGDSTRMTATMHSFYLRAMYLENKLIEPGGITLAGTTIDLGRINLPKFILATRDDHIAPWKSAYAGVHAYGGPVKFCLGASGHIAGVINPPSSGKYAYWTNSRKPKNPQAWLDGATEHAGSWWPEWSKWIARHGGGKVAARVPGDGALAVIEAAPGTYAKVKLA